MSSDQSFPDLESAIQAGLRSFEAGNFEDAVRALMVAVNLAPDRADLRNSVGQALRAAGKLGEAAEAYRTATELDPSMPEPWLNLGALASAAGNHSLAMTYYDQALDRDAGYAEAYFNRGVAAEAMGDTETAREAYEKALAVRPEYLAAQVNLGTLLSPSAPQEAERHLGRALELNPMSGAAWNGMGNLHRSAGRLSEAADFFSRAHDLGTEEAGWNLALVELGDGRLETGWGHYRHRPSSDRARFPMPETRLPEDLSGTEIKLAGEQGLGDELFFLRFAHLVRERGGSVAYAPDPRLKPVIEPSDLIGRFIEPEEAEYALPDLPYLLGTTESPPSIGLTADQSVAADARALLQRTGPAPYLGVTWRAGIAAPGSLFKSIPVIDLSEAIRNWPGSVISLQRNPAKDEIGILSAVLMRPVLDLAAVNDDLGALTGVLSCLDDYVGVSNTNMHLRAGLGGSARVLVPNPPEYRWMNAGDRSPWFPEFPVYRQSLDGGWGEALTRLAKDLVP